MRALLRNLGVTSDTSCASAAGAVALFAAAGALYAVPWRPSSRRGSLRELNAMWPARFVLELLLAFWAVRTVDLRFVCSRA